MALQPFVGPWPLPQFRKSFFTEMTGHLGRVICSSQGRYLHTGQHKHSTNAYADIHALSWIRTDDPRVWAREDSLRLTSRGHCDQFTFTLHGVISQEIEHCWENIKSWIKKDVMKQTTENDKRYKLVLKRTLSLHCNTFHTLQRS
jgi:hypothetical protein